MYTNRYRTTKIIGRDNKSEMGQMYKLNYIMVLKQKKIRLLIYNNDNM